MSDNQDNSSEEQSSENPGTIDTETFLKVADKFLEVANEQRKTVLATDVHVAFLFAAARYNAHVAKNIAKVEDQEDYIGKMIQTYSDMLRSHMADPNT